MADLSGIFEDEDFRALDRDAQREFFSLRDADFRGLSGDLQDGFLDRRLKPAAPTSPGQAPELPSQPSAPQAPSMLEQVAKVPALARNLLTAERGSPEPAPSGENVWARGAKHGLQRGFAGAEYKMANAFMLLDKVAGQVAKATGTERGGAFGKGEKFWRERSAEIMELAEQGRGDSVQEKIAEILGGLPVTLPEAIAAVSVGGPIAGFAGLAALGVADQDAKTIVTEAAKGGFIGSLFKFLAPLSRVPRGAAIGGAAAGLSSAEDPVDVALEGLTMGILGGAGKARPRAGTARPLEPRMLPEGQRKPTAEPPAKPVPESVIELPPGEMAEVATPKPPAKPVPEPPVPGVVPEGYVKVGEAIRPAYHDLTGRATQGKVAKLETPEGWYEWTLGRRALGKDKEYTVTERGPDGKPRVWKYKTEAGATRRIEAQVGKINELHPWRSRAAEKPPQEPTPESMPPGRGGTRHPLRIPGRREVLEGEYVLVENADVVGSHSGLDFTPNKEYRGFNERDYADPKTGKMERRKVEHGADTFLADEVFLPSASATSGVPTVDPWLHVHGGNARRGMVERVYAGRSRGMKPEELKAAVIERAHRFGLDPSEAKGMREPMIVRRIAEKDMPTDRAGMRTFSRELNQTGTQEVHPVDRAHAAAADLDSAMRVFVDAVGKRPSETTRAVLSEPGESKRFAEALQKDGIIPPEDVPRFLGEDGRLNEAGMDFAEEVLLARVLGDREIQKRVPRDLRSRILRMTPAIMRVENAAPGMIQEKVLGVVRSEIARQATKMPAKGGKTRVATLDEFLAQGDFVNPAPSQMDPSIATLHRLIIGSKPKEAAQIMGHFAERLESAKSGQGELLTGRVPTREEIQAEFMGLERVARTEIAERGGEAGEVVKPPADPLTEAKTGTPFRATMFRGSGREDPGAMYAEGISGPILGKGEYWAFDKETAHTFGPNIATAEVALRNPLVIRNDADLRRALGLNNIPMIAKEMVPAAQRMRERAIRAGHDGVVVEARWDRDFDAETRAGFKRTREWFGGSQVVKFPEREVRITEQAQARIWAKAEPAVAGDQWVPDRAPATADIPIPKNLVRAGDVLEKLAKGLKLPIQQGRLRHLGKLPPGAIGLYAKPGGTLRIKNWGDLQTASHEVGHALADRYPVFERMAGLDTRSPKELQALEEQLRISYDRESPSEGFAEFVRLWMTQRAQAANLAPTRYEFFEEAVAKLPRRERKALLRARDEMHAFYEQGPQAAIATKIGPEGDPGSPMTGRKDQSYQAGFDDLHGIWAAEVALHGRIKPDGPYETARRFRGVADITTGIYKWGVPRWTGRGQEIEFPENAPGLRDILIKNATSNRSLDGFLRYTIARRAKQLLETDEGLELSQRRARELVPEMERSLAEASTKAEKDEIRVVLKALRREASMKIPKRQRLWSHEVLDKVLESGTPKQREAHAALVEFHRDALKFARHGGLISAEQEAAIHARNSEYSIAFFREIQRTKGTQVLSGVSRTPLPHMKGSTRSLAANPVDTLLKGPSRVIEATMRNKAKLELYDQLGRIPGHGKWFQRIDPDSRQVQVTLENIRRQIKREYAAVGMEAPKKLLKDPGMPEAVNLWLRGDKPAGEGIDVVMRNGKPEYYQILDPILERSIARFQRPTPNKVASAWIKARRFKQSAITSTPGFLLRMASRDVLWRPIVTRAGRKYIRNSLRGYTSAFLQGRAYRDFIANGAGGGTLLNAVGRSGRADLIRYAQFKRANPRLLLPDPKNLVLTARDAWRLVTSINRAMEQGPRVAEFLAASRKGGSKTHGAYLGRDTMVDFAQRGDWGLMNLYRDTVPFGNAQLTSAEKFLRSTGISGAIGGRGDPTHKLATATKMLGVISAGTALHAANLSNPEYRKLPQYIRDSYLHYFVPTGEFDENGDPITEHYMQPTLWDIGVGINVMNRIMDSLIQSDDENERNLGSSLLQLMLKSYAFSLPAGFDDMIEQAMNHNLYKDRPIERKGLEDTSPGMRSTTYTPRTLRHLGEFFQGIEPSGDTSWIPNIIESPDRLNHLLYSWLSEWGEYGVKLMDSTLYPEERVAMHPEDQPIVRSFRGRQGKWDKAGGEFYDLWAEVKQAKNAMRDFEERGKYGEAARIEEGAHYQAYEIMEPVYRDIATINAEINEIRMDDSLSPEQRMHMQDALIAEKRALQNEVLEEVNPMMREAR